MTVPIPGRDADQEAVGQLLLLALQSIVNVYDHARVPLPDRRYVSYGAVAADCEQLTVQLGQVYPGTPGSDPNVVQRCDGPRTAVLVVQLFRKAPTASGPRGQGAPTPEALTAMALASARDSWLLLDAAHAIDAAGWNTGIISEVSPVDTSGGLVGASMTLTLQVP